MDWFDQNIKSLEAGEAWVRRNLSDLSEPGLVLLSGPMGAGKTQVTQWLLKALGSNAASSPTYAIHQRYEIKGKQVDHFDLYRLEGDADLESTGFWDIVKESDNLVIVEWADRLPEDAYPNRPQFHLKISGEGESRTYSSKIIDSEE